MAEQKGKCVSFFKYVLVMISDWSVIFAEGVVRWESNFMFREFQIGIVPGNIVRC
jgi:hypothetical protein